MYSTDRAKSSSPVAATSATAPAFATPTTSNAARQDALGLAADVPATTAGGMAEALAAMGSCASVVLDAMPLGAGVKLAWSMREMDWARAWLVAQDAADLVEHAPEVLEETLDTLWPVGLGMGIGAVVSGRLLAGLGTDSSGTVERTAEALKVRLVGSLGGDVGGGVSLALLDARGDAFLGGTAQAKAGMTGRVAACWTLPTVFSFVPAPVTREAVRMLVQGAPDGVMALIGRVIEDHIRAQLPDELRLESTEALKGRESVAAGVGGLSGEGQGSATQAIGWDSRGQYVEATIEALGMVAPWILEALAGAGATSPVFKAASGFTLRVEASPEKMTAQQLDQARFVVTSTDGGMKDSFVTTSLSALVSWLLGRATGAPEGARTVEVADVSLRRGVQRAGGELPADRLPAALRYAASVLPDHGPLVGYGEVALSAEVVVGPDAVRAATWGSPLVADDETAEDATLDAERAIAAALVGGAAPAADPCLDLERGAAAAKLERAERTATLTFAAGGGVAAEAEVGGSVQARSNLKVFFREPLEADEARQELVAK